MEAIVAHDSGAMIIAENDGEVISADSARIVVRTEKVSGGRVKTRRSQRNLNLARAWRFWSGHRLHHQIQMTAWPSTDRGQIALI